MSTEATMTLFDTKAHNPSFASVRSALPDAKPPVDFLVPVNRHFPPPSLMESIRDSLPEIVKYYPDYAETHQQHLAELAKVPAENIVAANGSTELITMLCREAKGPMCTSIPTFGQWTDLPIRLDLDTAFIARLPENDFQLSVEQIVEHVRQHNIQTLVLSNPNNPSGAAFQGLDIAKLAVQLADIDTIIIDESFIDFSDCRSAAPLATRLKNLVVVKSLGKSLGWHGVRLGYAIANEERASRLRTQLPYWNINGLAAFILQKVAGMRNELVASFAKTRRDRTDFIEQLGTVDRLRVFPSQANFVLVEIPSDVSGKALRDTLLQEYGLLIRECGNKVGSSEQYLRLAVNLPLENAKLVYALAQELKN